jgi:hypothetical protein
MKFKEVVIPRLRVLLSRQVPDLSRRSTIDLADACVESPHAAEAGSKRNLTHRQTRLVDELFSQSADGACAPPPSALPPGVAGTSAEDAATQLRGVPQELLRHRPPDHSRR